MLDRSSIKVILNLDNKIEWFLKKSMESVLVMDPTKDKT
jgi:hypothetical protein